MIEVRHSPIHGRGVFATRRIRKGREIIEYKGKRISHAEADAEGPDTGHTFLFTLNDEYVIDAGRGGNAARFINHSCKPNCTAYWIEAEPKNPKKDRVVIEARRDIEPGEELSYVYDIQFQGPITKRDRELWACRCGAPKCRGTMLDEPRKKRTAKRSR